MAPSVTETVGLRSATFTVPLKTDSGHNKENLIGYKYEKEAELNGTDKIAPASYPNYLPVWDNETERYINPRMMKIEIPNISSVDTHL